MHFSHIAHGSGGKLTKLSIVAVLHVAVAAALIQSMSTIAHVAPPAIIEYIDIPPLVTPPPAPPIPIEQPQIAPPPPIVTPQVEVIIEQPLVALVQSVIESDAVVPLETPTPGPAAPEQPAARPAKIYKAVLANADACITPDYPSRSARNGHTGVVTLALLVGANGRVAEARVQSTSGHRELDRAAIAALSMCEFKPATNNGIPEPAWAQIAYVWNLD